MYSLGVQRMSDNKRVRPQEHEPDRPAVDTNLHLNLHEELTDLICQTMQPPRVAPPPVHQAIQPPRVALPSIHQVPSEFRADLAEFERRERLDIENALQAQENMDARSRRPLDSDDDDEDAAGASGFGYLTPLQRRVKDFENGTTHKKWLARQQRRQDGADELLARKTHNALNYPRYRNRGEAEHMTTEDGKSQKGSRNWESEKTSTGRARTKRALEHLPSIKRWERDYQF
jgi:hypothetical protein